MQTSVTSKAALPCACSGASEPQIRKPAEASNFANSLPTRIPRLLTADSCARITRRPIPAGSLGMLSMRSIVVSPD